MPAKKKTAAPQNVAEKRGPRLWYWCPGCKTHHVVPVEPCEDTKPGSGPWQFNGDLLKPTLSPSVLHHGTAGYAPTCHYFMRDGVLQYQSDCGHEFKGQHVPMEPAAKHGL